MLLLLFTPFLCSGFVFDPEFCVLPSLAFILIRLKGSLFVLVSCLSLVS